VERFLNYPVNTLFAPAPDWKNPTFPDITICNACPLVHEKSLPLNYSEYVSVVTGNLSNVEMNNYLVQNNLTKFTEEQLININAAFSTPESYFRNFPITHLTDKSGRGNVFLVDNVYFQWDFTKEIYRTKMSRTGIRVTWNPEYYKCLTLTISDYKRQAVSGFSAIIFVQEFLDSIVSAYDLYQKSSRAAGVRVMVHAPGTKPDMKLGMVVSPGTETTISISQTVTSRLSYPYSNCTTETRLGFSKYTKNYCVEVCIQEQFLRKCGCIMSLYQFTEQQLKDANHTICGNLNITRLERLISWQGFGHYVCAELFKKDKAICDTQCLVPCTEYNYATFASSATWPQISSLASIFDTYKEQPLFGKKFNRYYTLLKLIIDEKTVEARDLLQELDKEGLIQHSFLQLNVKFDHSTFNEINDVVAFSRDAMIAQIGGVMSLWLGVTVMLLFEVCEFIYILVSKYCEKAGAQIMISSPQTTDSEAQTMSSQELGHAHIAQPRPAQDVNDQFDHRLFDVATAYEALQTNGMMLY